MKQFQIKDQLHRQVILNDYPLRIVSLVPSITETLFDLGLKDIVVGRTKFCIHPRSEVTKVKIIGGTKNIDIERVEALCPDLIIANKEENTKEVIDALSQKYPTYISDVKTVNDCLNLILDIGKMTNAVLQSKAMVADISNEIKLYPPKTLKNALYLIWKEPYMTIGNDTFIHQMMLESGFNNVYSDLTRYPEIQIESKISDTDIILLSSEPYPFKAKHVKAISEKYQKPVLLVDGEMYSWYGSRMKLAWQYFANLYQ